MIHKQELAAQSIGAHLRQITPRLVGALVHHLTESIPLSLGIGRAASCRSRSRDSGELVVARSGSGSVMGPELAVLVVVTVLSLNIDRLYFSEVTIGVVSQSAAIGQDVLHSSSTLTNLIQNALLLDQCILKRGGILIKNARGLDAEVVNYGGGFGA